MRDGVVLVVEDDDDLRQDLVFLLERRGYRAAEATNGLDALGWIRENGVPCIVVLDLMMPVMDGRSFRQALLLDPTTQDLPVVVVSGAAGVAQSAQDLGAAAWLQKPIDLDRLFGLLEEHCRRA